MKKIFSIIILLVIYLIVNPIYFVADKITYIFSFLGNKISEYILHIVKKYKIRIRWKHT